jgi:hypothetical protein
MSTGITASTGVLGDADDSEIAFHEARCVACRAHVARP